MTGALGSDYLDYTGHLGGLGRRALMPLRKKKSRAELIRFSAAIDGAHGTKSLSQDK